MNSQNASSNLKAIITFHQAINYGAILQAYALQKTIQHLGYQCEILNYTCAQIKESYQKPKKSIKSQISWMLNTNNRRSRSAKFKAFIDANMILSSDVSREDLSEYCRRYSTLIVGSDQVWNPLLTGNDRTYFLDFLDDSKKKVAYAASLGVEKWQKDFELEGKSLVSKFRVITVRESSAAAYLRDLLERNIDTVCDPVFLLSRNAWGKLAVSSACLQEQFVLIFSFGQPPRDCLEWGRRRAADLNCKLVVLHFGPFPIPGVLNVRDAGPEEYLGWIKKSCFVISPSFHAICFSIIFERQFCWFNSDSDDSVLKSRSSRITDLLTNLNLKGNAVNKSSSFPAPINYPDVRELLDAWREKSLQILVKALEG